MIFPRAMLAVRAQFGMLASVMTPFKSIGFSKRKQTGAGACNGSEILGCGFCDMKPTELHAHGSGAFRGFKS